MLHEQANLVFTILFNLRETGESKGPFFVFDFLDSSNTVTDLAFPIHDDAVRDYLVKTSVSGDRHIL